MYNTIISKKIDFDDYEIQFNKPLTIGKTYPNIPKSYLRECELWHYEGIGHYHWRRKKSAKQERALLKLEIKKRAADFPEQL